MGMTARKPFSADFPAAKGMVILMKKNIYKKLISFFTAAALVTASLSGAFFFSPEGMTNVGASYNYEAITGEIASAAAEIIALNETNKSYGSINLNDNGAVSLGIFQWHGPRALTLLASVAKTIPEKTKSIIGDTLYNEIMTATQFDWNTRSFTKEEGAVVSQLLKTDEGIAAQIALSESDASAYVAHGRGIGLVEPAALVYYCDLENQMGQTGVKTYTSAAFNITGSYSEIDLEALHNAALLLSTGSAAINRRNRTYAYAAAVEFSGITPSADLALGIPYSRPEGEVNASSSENDRLWLANVLVILGLTTSVSAVSDFDASTVELIKTLQTRCGLYNDGICGANTIRKITELLVSEEYRYPAYYIVSTDSGNLYIRSTPDTASSSNIISSMPKDAECIVSGTATSADGTLWNRISYNGIDGYSSAKYMKFSRPLIPNAPTVSVVPSDEAHQSQVKWAAVSGASHYHVEIFADGASTPTVCADNVTALSYSFVLPHGSYKAVISSVLPNGRFASSAPAAFSVAKRTVLTPTLTIEEDNRTVFLDWDDDSAAQKYSVYRGTDGKSFSLIGETADSSFADSAVDVATLYYYYVVANGEDSTAKSGTYCITTKNRVLSGINIMTKPWKTDFGYGEEISFEGLTLLTVYSDGVTICISEGFNLTGYDAFTSGKQTVTAEYMGFTATFDITVGEAPEQPTLRIDKIYAVDDGVMLEWTVRPVQKVYVMRAAKNGSEIIGYSSDGFFLDETAVAGVEYCYTILTDNLSYALPAYFTKPYGVTCWGDANDDGEANIIDASMVVSYIVGNAPLNDLALASCDVNHDGTVDIMDASMILQYCVYNIDKLG